MNVFQRGRFLFAFAIGFVALSGTSVSMAQAARPIAKLVADDGASQDRFGRVALSGDTALVGALGDDADRGAVYVFERSGDDWAQTGKLQASDGLPGDRFGKLTRFEEQLQSKAARGRIAQAQAAIAFDASGQIRQAVGNLMVNALGIQVITQE